MPDLLYLDGVGNIIRYGRTDSTSHVCALPFNSLASCADATYSPADIVGGDVNKLKRMDATVVSLPQRLQAC
jgi:hypothetical protein